MNAPTALGDEDAAPQPLDALLAALGLQDASSSALLLELRAMLQHRVVQPGEVLLRQGDSGD